MEQVILLSGVVDGSKLKVFRLPEGVNANPYDLEEMHRALEADVIIYDVPGERLPFVREGIFKYIP